MIERPENVNAELEAAVSGGKNLVFTLSPTTTVTINSTDPAEAQQVLEALQPVEESDAPAHIRHEAEFALLHAFTAEPTPTIEWVRELLQLMEESV